MIQGGGYIAVEFACIFAGLGSEVTLVYRGENILRGFDDDVREHLRNEMRSRGITVTCGHTVAADSEKPATNLSRGFPTRAQSHQIRSCSRSAVTRMSCGFGLDASGGQNP